jgi:hypothetical protein
MSEAGAKMILDRWVEDPRFREDVRSDPAGAARAIGADVDEEQLQFLRSVDWTLTDEELEPLLEKGFFC